jgi:hypothetical protein
MNTAATLVQLTRAASIFDRVADGLVARVRGAMAVPEQADADIEQEFTALRAKLDAFFPEFRELFAGLLVRHVGEEELPLVLSGLSSEVAQRYFRATGKIEADMQLQLVELSQRMGVALQNAFAHGDGLASANP